MADRRANIISAVGHAQPQCRLQPETLVRVIKLDHRSLSTFTLKGDAP
jgi:hypothetical protein